MFSKALIKPELISVVMLNYEQAISAWKTSSVAWYKQVGPRSSADDVIENVPDVLDGWDKNCTKVFIRGISNIIMW